MVAGAWLAVAVAGIAALWMYATTPGAGAQAPRAWPEDSAIKRGDRFTLLMFAHPRCSCTRASLNELAWIVRQHREQVSTYVVFPQPAGTGSGWLQSTIVAFARSMGGIRVFEDQRGEESQRFRSMTSGQVLLYDPEGLLTFSGGITGSRGHEGDNLGRARVAALISGVSGRHARDVVSSVFGCELWDPR
ncbi:MAG: RedB protein [Myxococcales bacterium]